MNRAFLALILLAMLIACPGSGWTGSTPNEMTLDLPVKDTVTLVDLGAKTCIPCRMMAPILEELKVEYSGRAAVVFIDVREDRSQGPRFGIQSIPTQIFYDRHGKEVYRHVGFLDKEKIKERLEALLARE
jgi:thioredoxin 1